MSDRDAWWFPRRVNSDTAAQLRADYPDEASGMTDQELCKRYRYVWGKFEAPALWDHLGDATAEYNALAAAYLKLLGDE